jgi:hypothetical protein
MGERSVSLEQAWRIRRAARTAYSRHPAARVCRTWRRVARSHAADILMLPLTTLALGLLLLGTVPGASDAVAAACAAACLP